MNRRSRTAAQPSPATLELDDQLPPAPPSDDYMTPKEVSAHLWERWRLQRSERRLAQLRAAPVGCGPPYHRSGSAVRYRRSSVDDWALKQLGREHGSTSDEAAFRLQRRLAASAVSPLPTD